MKLTNFNISVGEVESTLKKFKLFRMRGIKSLNKDGVSEQFKSASIKEDYIKAYNAGLQNYDYDFLLEDQSYFQFQFSENEKFIDLRYAFFQNPINYISYDDFLEEQLRLLGLGEALAVLIEDISPLIKEEYDQYLNEQEIKGNYTTIRYDSDYSNYRPLIHAVSHIHIGHANNVRIPIDKIITPLKFVLFTIKHVYYQQWRDVVEVDENYINERFLAAKGGEFNLSKDMWCELEKIELFLR